jgi:hypothetical protein
MLGEQEPASEFAAALVNAVQRQDLCRVQDGRVQPVLDAVVQEDTVDDLSGERA